MISIQVIKRADGIFHFAINILVLLVFLWLVSCGFASEKSISTPSGAQHASKVLIIGHRGAAGLAPENTLSAFQKACEIGVDAVELDVLMTSDSNIVVHHDYTLNPDIARMTGGEWLRPPGQVVKNLSLAELRTYDVGRLKPNTRYSRRYPVQQPVDGERIPTLVEVISVLKDRCDKEAQVWIEIKTNPEKPDLTPPPEIVADAVVRILNQENFSTRSRILSFDWRVLVHVQKVAPEIPTVYLSLAGRSLNNIKPGRPGASPWMAGFDIDDFSGSIPRAVNAAGGRFWAPYYKHLTYNRLTEARDLDLKVFVWTPDKYDALIRLTEMGVDGIITNRPDVLKGILNEP